MTCTLRLPLTSRSSIAIKSHGRGGKSRIIYATRSSTRSPGRSGSKPRTPRTDQSPSPSTPRENLSASSIVEDGVAPTRRGANVVAVDGEGAEAEEAPGDDPSLCDLCSGPRNLCPRRDIYVYVYVLATPTSPSSRRRASTSLSTPSSVFVLVFVSVSVLCLDLFACLFVDGW